MEKEIINKRLSELKTSEEGVITKVFGHGSFRNRITEMGFVRGKTVRVIKNAPLSDPIEYEIMGYRIALRKSEAELIEVSLPSGGTAGSGLPSGGTFRDESVNRFQHVTGRTINVALVGNPNSGKTSLFNVASGSHERVGNYSGVTVDAKQAVFRQDGYTFNLFDLPGTYSITEYTPEELYVRRHILDAMPDVVINVLDASNLERNLFLTTQLIDMDLKVVIALNMYDELEKSGLKLDYRNLGRMIGIPIVPTVASRGEGIRELFKTVIDVFEDNEPIVRHIHINYGKDIEHSIRLLQDEIWKNTDLVARYSSRYLAIKLLCNDKNGYEVVEPAANFAEISAVAEHERQKLERQYKDCVETIITDAKFGFIAGALEETCQGINLRKNRPDDRVDRIMTHKVWGLPIFLLIMWIMFQTTFSLGGVPAGWLETGVEWLGDFIGGIMREGPLRELIVNGIISGVGGVIVFLPNILILFFFISLMEDTGYMARAAFIMDKLMHKIGLHGKSFIPLLMGFGCNVPAIMATRTLESRKDRLMTMLIIPFMSCSARLPVYVLLISAFFPSNQGLVLFSIYLIGILIAIGSSILFKKLLFAKAEAPFVMELPPYRIPTTRNVVRHMWSKGSQYLRKMGTVILAASIIIWALGYYPRNVEYSVDYDRVAAEIASSGLSPEDEQAELQELDDIRPGRRTPKAVLYRKNRSFHRAGDPAARLRLADRNQPVQRTGGQGDRRQYDGRVEQQRGRRRFAGPEPAKTGIHARRQGGTTGLLAAGSLHADVIHPALRPLHRGHRSHTPRSRSQMGRAFGRLFDGLSMVIVFCRLPDRKLAIKNGKYAGNHYGNHHRGGIRLHAVFHLPVEQAERVRMRMLR